MKNPYVEIPEKNFEQLVKEAARMNGWMYYHTYRSIKSEPGFPDCVMVRGNRLIFAELKTQKGKLSVHQDCWLKTLDEVVGIECYVWRPSDWEEIEETLR